MIATELSQARGYRAAQPFSADAVKVFPSKLN